MMVERQFVLLCVVMLLLMSTACERAQEAQVAPDELGIEERVTTAPRDNPQKTLAEILSTAQRIPNSTGWFEILKLPNQVYAFWEPGHAEKVNAFLILGSKKDVLYDTGMGIASIATAIADVRAAENLPERELMLINSHNHLDHNGGNSEFPAAWIYEDAWGIEKLTQGVPGNIGFDGYWNQLTPHPGVQVPEGFDPVSKSIPPYPRDQIKFLKDGEMVDLGDRQFRVLHVTSHSPDGIALYDEENRLLFGGDTYYGAHYLVTDISLLSKDLDKTQTLQVDWHYASHGSQLIETMQHGMHLAIVRRMIAGERNESTTFFAGVELPLYELDGVSVTLAGEVLIY